MEKDTLNEKCGIDKLSIDNNAMNIKKVDLGDDDDYDIEF